MSGVAFNGARSIKFEDLVHALVRHVDVHGAEAADACHLRIDHPLDEGAGERRVDGIAAALEHFRAGFDCLRLRRHDRCVSCRATLLQHFCQEGLGRDQEP